MIDTEADAVATSRAYIEAVSDHDLTPLETILDDGLVATLSGDRFGKREWIDALERLLPVLIRNDIREVFVSGQRASVVYDFVTDTPAGAVICVELVTVRKGRITEIELVFDRVAFAPAQAELKARAAR
ncbi:MAG: nuclear transport factor 2 family protein [Leifsonia sp.]